MFISNVYFSDIWSGFQGWNHCVGSFPSQPSTIWNLWQTLHASVCSENHSSLPQPTSVQPGWKEHGNSSLTLIAKQTNRPAYLHIQIYGCFFPGDLVTRYSIDLLLMNELQSSLHTFCVAMSNNIHAIFRLQRTLRKEVCMKFEYVTKPGLFINFIRSSSNFSNSIKI